MNRKHLFFILTICLLAFFPFQNNAQGQQSSGPFFDLREDRLSDKKIKGIDDILNGIMVDGEPIQTYFVVYPPYIQAPGVEIKRKALAIDASVTNSQAIVAMSLWGVYDYLSDKVRYSLEIVASKKAERLIGKRLDETNYSVNSKVWSTEMLEAAKEAQVTDKDKEFLPFLAQQFSQRIGGTQQEPDFFIDFHELQAQGRLDRYNPKQQALSSEYENLTAKDKTVKIPWLAVESGVLSEAIFELPDKAKPSFEKNIFLNLNGQAVSHAKVTSQEKQFKFSVSASGDMTTTELKAQYGSSVDNAPYTVGQLNLASYNEKSFTVVIVPAGGDLKNITQSRLKKYLDEVYGQAIVKWKVEIESPLGDRSWDRNGNGKLADEGMRLSNYTDEMNDLVGIYSKSRELDKKNKYYLFVVDKPESQMGKQGYMPRKRQVGFIFSGNHSNQNQLMHTIAHELGHGTFRLEHTFKEFPSLTQGSTDNLMDYTVQQKTNLLKYQWDHIHDPVAMIGWLQDNEDAANIFNCTWDKLLEYMSFTQTPIEKELEAKKGMFDKVYENYEEYKQKIKENAEGGFKEKEIEKINDWIIRGESAKTKKKYKKTMSLHNVVLEKIIQSKEDSIYYNVWEKGVLLGELEKEGINYPMAIYSMQEKFYIKKLEHTDYCDLIRDETLNKIIKVSDFGDYLLLTFLEGDDIRMVVQLMSNDDEKMEKILKLFGVLKDEEPFELEESESEAVASATVPVSEKVLTDVFSGLSTEKAKEISDAINKYSDKYEIDTPEKMAHFIGQIGVESGGLTALKEKHTYSPRRIVEIFPYANRGHFYEQAVFNETTKTYSYEAVNFDINNCEGTHANKGNADFDYSNATQIVNAYADTLAEVPNEDYKVFANRDDVYWDKGDHNLREKTPSSSYNEGKIRIKSEYINSETMFDVAYACKNGNGSIASQDGSRYKGVGYIHLTGKDNYSIVYNKWKSDNLAERKDITIESFIESMKTDIDVAMEAAMIYWDNNNLNNLITTTDDSEGTVFRNNVRKIGGKVNTGDVDATEAEIGSFSGRLEKSQLIYNEL